MTSRRGKEEAIDASGEEFAAYDPRALGQRIKVLRQELQHTQAQFSALLGTSQPTVSRWEAGLFTPQDSAFLQRMADMAGVTLSEFRYGPAGSARKVAVAGYVGAGAKIFPVDDFPPGSGLEMVPAPEGVGGKSVVGVRVRGDSMMPMMKDGWLAFYHRDQTGVPDDCIGKLCVVKVADDGPTLVKEVRHGSRPDTFTLLSVNADPIEDVKLEWAARVVSIRPV
jgi:phage repressor protein C with HTH and peptisase S24 domain